MDKKLLIIEDNKEIVVMIKEFLEPEGFQVHVAYDGQEGLMKHKTEKYDLILLDIMMPRVNGIDVLQKIREIDLVPVIMVSAKESDFDKAIALELGADDYITKPFSLIELKARIRATIRRSTSYNTPKEDVKDIVIGPVNINLNNYSVSVHDQIINLTAKEFAILSLLAKHPSMVFTKAQIYESIWKESYYGDENVINVHILRLRKKLEVHEDAVGIIKTLWGIGYKIGDLS